MQRQIRFTIGGSSSIFGNFAAGDLLRCDAEAARHFVEDARCARYTDAPPAEPAAVTPVNPDAAPTAPRARKPKELK